MISERVKASESMAEVGDMGILRWSESSDIFHAEKLLCTTSWTMARQTPYIKAKTIIITNLGI